MTDRDRERKNVCDRDKECEREIKCVNASAGERMFVFAKDREIVFIRSCKCVSNACVCEREREKE